MDDNASQPVTVKFQILDSIERLVSRLGFPIVVAGFVLLRLDPAVRDLTAVMRDVQLSLTHLQTQCCRPADRHVTNLRVFEPD